MPIVARRTRRLRPPVSHSANAATSSDGWPTFGSRPTRGLSGSMGRRFLVRPCARALAGSSVAAATLLPAKARAQGRTRKRRPIEPDNPRVGLDPNVGQPSEDVAAFAEWDTGGLSRLVRRATMGITPAEVTRATALGWNGYLNYQLN